MLVEKEKIVEVSVVWIVAVVGLLAVIEMVRLRGRLDRIEEMLAKVLDHLNVDASVSMEPSDTVKRLAADRKSYVQAIKAYREQTGLGLKPAKAMIDRLAAGHVAES
jgi:ribosomal protein L7/L12